jgi:cytochrome c biogenesis protein CcmG/thiol:disulfide interchange protein DsbE
MRTMRPFVIVALVIAGVVIAEVATNGRSNDLGRPAPELPNQVLVPPKVDLASLRGKPAILNFWASWCEPCKREAPGLERLGKSLRGRARLVGVDWGDSGEGARAFISRYHWTFPNLRDAGNAVGGRFGLRGLPTTFILDSNGRIAAQLPGPHSADAIERVLRSVSP